MKLNSIRKRALVASSALNALALVGAGAGVAAIAAAPAYAQDYTSGAMTGTVTDESGATVSGATVTITSADTGTSRTATSSANGTFRVTGLPAGTYNVDATGPSGGTYRAEGVNLLSSTTLNLGVTLSSGDVIVVTGAQIQQDFTGTTTGINLDVAELAKTVALPRTLSSLMLLAPGTTRGDSSFGDLVSVGGSSVAENAYYLNGLNVTNFDTYLGSARVPFEFYKSVELKSGGYPAEYGRATGGIVNQVTKSGSNEFTAAVHINWEPNFLQSYGKDLLDCGYIDQGTPSLGTECTRSTDEAADSASARSMILEAGGPIIKDRLFVYGLAEFRESESVVHDASSGIAYFRENNDPFWGAKVDAYPIDSQHLEFTIFDTRNTTHRVSKSYIKGEDGKISYGPGSNIDYNYGGVNWVGKYTGNMTDWFTVSAAYGVYKDRFDQVIDGASTPYVFNGSGSAINGVPNGAFFNDQTASSQSSPYEIQRKFFRADADLYFSLLGDHHIRGGYDVENNSLAHTTVRTGGGDLCGSGFLTDEACSANGVSGAGAALLYRTESDGQSSVEVNYYNAGGTFKAKNQAFYIEDEWNIGSRLTLNLGLRRDDFRVDKADGTNLVNLKENYAPRLAAQYKLWGDESGTIKAAFGQYYLPVASNTAYRQASAEYYVRERYYYDGFDSDGVPVLGDQVTNNNAYQGNCPIALTYASTGGYCNVTGDGSVSPSDAAIAHNLKATKETEWLVGYEHRLGDWTFGLTYTHRNLDRNAEDMAIDAAVLQYCADNGLTGCEDTWTGYNQYVITNPGSDLVVNLYGQDGREVTFSADSLGYPKAKRTYDAIDFTFERAFDGVWSVKGSYTWSKSKGNSEGFVQSDFGQDDAGITQDFDQPGFLPGAYGYLPNDRRHRFKMFGSVAMNDWFTVGLNASVESPRPLSCFGYNPFDDFANGYGAASHYCGGELSPRGTAQETNWVSQFDVSFRAKKELATGQTVVLRADVFNLFNSQAITSRYEIGDLNDAYLADPQFGQATGYQTPRYVRIGADIEF